MKVYLLLGLVILTLLLAGCSNSVIGGNAICDPLLTLPDYETKIIDVEGNGFLDKSATIQVHNKEKDQAIKVIITLDCWSVDKKETFHSDENWVEPDEKLKIDIPIKLGFDNDWKCSNVQISSSKVYGCK